MYFIDAIKYPFNSEGVWGKIGMAFLLMLIPIVNFFGMIVLVGYGLKIIASVMHGNETLPEFDLGNDFMRGIIVILVSIVYQIPVMILTGILVSVANNSSALSVVIVLILVFVSIISSLLLMIALIRYAATEDTNVFLAVVDNFGYLSGNVGAVVMLLINSILFGLVVSILVSIGFVLLIIPGIIMSIASMFSSFYLYARFGQELGIGAKAKNYA